jgi:RNA polymerase sigma factor (TIGR02999 family)
MVASMSEVTRILSAIEQGDPHAGGQLLPLVYDELRRLAAQKLAQEKPGQTLQATALVHEAYLRLVAPASGAATASGAASARRDQHWNSRGHFFAAAAEAMRRILVENARRKGRRKHGGGRQRVDLDAVQNAFEMPADHFLALDEALAQLAERDRQTAELVKLHCFAGLSITQAAQSLGISSRTAYRDWAFAQAWLYREIQGGETGPET